MELQNNNLRTLTMKQTLYILVFAVSAAMAATGCMKRNPILPFDAPRYVTSDAQTVTCVPEGRSGVTCVPEGRSGYSVTEVRFSICDVSTEKGEQIEYGQVEFNAGDNCWENSWCRIWQEGRNIKVSFSENTSESLTREISVYYTPDDPDLFDWGIHMTQLPYGMTEEEYLQWLDSL